MTTPTEKTAFSTPDEELLAVRARVIEWRRGHTRRGDAGVLYRRYALSSWLLFQIENAIGMFPQVYGRAWANTRGQARAECAKAITEGAGTDIDAWIDFRIGADEIRRGMESNQRNVSRAADLIAYELRESAEEEMPDGRRSRMQELEDENRRLRNLIESINAADKANAIIELDTENSRMRTAFKQLLDKLQDRDKPFEILMTGCEWCGESWPKTVDEPIEVTHEAAKFHLRRCEKHPLKILLDQKQFEIEELRSAVIGLCDEWGTRRERADAIRAHRETANCLRIPFSFDEVHRRTRAMRRGNDERIVMLARTIGEHWRDQQGMNAALVDELASITKPDDPEEK